MCQPHSGHQELLQGAVDKNAFLKLWNEEMKTVKKNLPRCSLQTVLKPQTLLFLPVDELRSHTIVYFALL